MNYYKKTNEVCFSNRAKAKNKIFRIILFCLSMFQAF